MESMSILEDIPIGIGDNTSDNTSSSNSSINSIPRDKT